MTEKLKYGLSENLIVELSPKPKNKIFIICPVRVPNMGILDRLYGAKKQWIKTQNTIKAYVEKLEKEGYEVYWPYRDNPYQKTDLIGLKIISHNCKKMHEANEVHIWYYQDSIGSIFDIGMFLAFARVGDFKKFSIINREKIAPTPDKSFENVILALEKDFDNAVTDGLKEKWEKYEK